MASISLAHRGTETYRRTGPRTGAPSLAKPRAASTFLLVATLAYLCVEVPFAARLVDVLASDASEAAIHEVERTGRLVSGLALALLAWGYLLRPGKPHLRPKPARTLALMLVALVASMVVMGHGQRSLVDTLSDNSSAALRQAALKGAIARDAYHRPKPDAPTDAGKLALAAAIPALAASSKDGLAAVRDASRATRIYAASLVPAAGDLRKRVYEPAISELRDAYKRYRDGADKLAALPSTAARKSEDSYREMWDEIRDRRVTGIGNAQVNMTVANGVRNRGIPVPTYWDPRDAATFHAVYAEKARREGREAYESTVRSALGQDVALSPDLRTFDAFLAAAPVQARVRRGMGLPAAGPALRAAPGESEFADSVVTPLKQMRASDLERAVGPDTRTLNNGANLAEAGRSAVRMAIATSLALILSAVGALGHLAKAANHALVLAGVTARVRLAGTATLLAVLVSACLPLSASLSNAVWAGTPEGPWGMALGWAIGAHAMIHPVGSLLSAVPGLGSIQSLIGFVAGG